MTMALIDTTGIIKPTPGTPLPALPMAKQTTILNTYSDFMQPVSAFVVRSLSGNSANNKVYLLSNNQPADKTAYSNVLWYFEVPNEAISFTSGPGTNVYQLDQMFIDADNNGDGVIITYEIY